MIKPFPKSTLSVNRKRFLWSEDMTLCVAAFAQDKIGKVHVCWGSSSRNSFNGVGNDL
jgi:hypothetical protein